MSEAATKTRIGISRTLRRAVGGPDESAPKRTGRPTDYDPFMVAEAAGMIQMGATDGEVCEALGISSATYYRWVHVVPGFRETIERSKGALMRVENSLFSRAVGKAKKRVTITDADGRVSERVEELPPDPRAQHIWLTNKSPDKWRNRTEHELVVPETAPDLSPEEQDTRRLALAAIALMNEAAESPLTLDGSYDRTQEPEGDDEAGEDDWEGEPDDIDL